MANTISCNKKMSSLKLKATGKLTVRLDTTKGSISEQVDIYEEALQHIAREIKRWKI